MRNEQNQHNCNEIPASSILYFASSIMAKATGDATAAFRQARSMSRCNDYNSPVSSR